KKTADLFAGIGDDCAVLRPSDNKVQLITCDSLIESVHFDLSWHPPELLGAKAVSVNVSDIAAMGGQPRFALLALGLSRGCENWLDSFLQGFEERLQDYQVRLIGGDTVNSKGGFMITVTVIGEMDKDKVCYRSGAREGDLVWVSGPLGEAAAGLEICRNAPGLKNSYPSLVSAHLSPEPRLELGGLLARSGLVHAMIDLSDGLATDLAHICGASGVGAEVFQKDIPFTREFTGLARELGLSAFDWALKGGGDYQLLFTTDPENREAVTRLAVGSHRTLYPVGRMVKGSGVILCDGENRQDITFQGYEHR
ncbi:MAG: thiamine-phosphate kinase, partial [Thermodesulfobacteriota bacterium]